MATTDMDRWEDLEQWSPSAFIGAGVLLLGYATLQGINSFTSLTLQSAVLVLYGGIALLAPVFALLGLYRRLRDHAPRMALAGVATAILSGLLTFVALMWAVVATLQMDGLPAIPADAPAWTSVATLSGFLLLAVSFLLFGVASLRTPVVSRTVALLLLVPTAAWVGLVVGNAILNPEGHYLAVLVYTPISLALLAVGYHLRTKGVPTDRAELATTEARHD